MGITEADRKEQKERCESCNSESMEWCITHSCPYWGVKHYTEADRKFYNENIVEQKARTA